MSNLTTFFQANTQEEPSEAHSRLMNETKGTQLGPFADDFETTPATAETPDEAGEAQARQKVDDAFAELGYTDEEINKVAMPYHEAPNVQPGLLQQRPERTPEDQQLQAVITSRLGAVLEARHACMQGVTKAPAVTHHQVAGKSLSYDQSNLGLAA